jgi:hypothetical protein
MALVEAGRFYTSIEGAMARARLAADGIDSVLFDTEMNWGGLDGVVPVRLMVDEDDLARAERVLAETA